jgi:uncharacterized protein (DUF952 family)/mannose-6-phosphate isomerase-like protein (cupin superfamily)
MILKSNSVQSVEWQGLSIQDYTPGKKTSSSVARIRVPPGGSHVEAWSRRSDKFYYVLSGQLHFMLDGQIHVLSTGDLGIVAREHHFAYQNRTNRDVTFLLIHTPPFEEDQEVLAAAVFAVPMIYHVVKKAAWQDAAARGIYRPASFEHDGFIHFCEADEIAYVGNHYYAGETDLVLLCVAPGRVTAEIRYEDLTGEGIAFPHGYGPLNTDAVEAVLEFAPNPDGTFSAPKSIRRDQIA